MSQVEGFVHRVTGTITLTSGQLSITDSLSISGPGIDALSVSGGGVSRVFWLAGSPTVSIANLTVANGNASTQIDGGFYHLGGGIYMGGGTLSLDHCNVSGNRAVNEGGGIYMSGSTLVLNQCTVSGNHAEDYGGGGALGGGLFVAGGTLTLGQSTVAYNSAFGSPGYYADFGYDGGRAEGGGLFISRYDYNPAVYLDTFTVDHTINNTPDNIVGPYFLLGMPLLAISDVTVLEGNTGTTSVVFTVSLSAASDQPVTVNYATADGTATVGSDYMAATGTLTIPAGQTTGTITVLVNGDRLSEPSETFVVNLSSPTNSTIADGQGVGTITDDEPRISIGDMSKKEGNSGLTAFAFTVSLSVPYDVPVTIGYSTANGSATAGSDYQDVEREESHGLVYRRAAGVRNTRLVDEDSPAVDVVFGQFNESHAIDFLSALPDEHWLSHRPRLHRRRWQNAKKIKQHVGQVVLFVKILQLTVTRCRPEKCRTAATPSAI